MSLGHFGRKRHNYVSYSLIQEGQLSVTGERMRTKYSLTLMRSKPAQEKCS